MTAGSASRSAETKAYIAATVLWLAAAVSVTPILLSLVATDPYAVLGTLVEGAVQTILQQVPQERQAETAATLVRLLKERLAVCGITNDEDGDGQQSSGGG
jgi:hypothetical protein